MEKIFGTIDPGAECAGAVFKKGRVYRTHLFTGRKDSTWCDRASYAAETMAAFMAVNLPAKGRVYIEYPAFFESFGGQVSARKGSLVKLAVVVGMTFNACRGRGLRPQFVNVNDWKGQLKKKIIERRIRRVVPGIELKLHEWDAVGIGLKQLGKI